MDGVITGGCQCGQVRYAISAPLPPAYCCHCDECRKQSASAFSMSVAIESAHLSVTGDVAVTEAISFSGKPKLRYFCRECGTRLWHRPSTNSDWITLKVGTLDDASHIAPRGHLWVLKKQPWIVIEPTTSVFDTQPDDVQHWRTNLK
jgi:hypothetical protein